MDELSITRACREPGIAGRTALVARGVELSYGGLAARASTVRAELAARGVGLGSRVALVAGNRAETVIALHALFGLGAVIVPIHPRLTPPEVKVLLDDAVPNLVLSDDDLEGAALPLPSVPAHPRRPAPPQAPLAMLYTSGTTGRSKGAVLSRAAFVASAAASAANLGWEDDDRWLVCLPLCHVGGLSIVTRCLLARRTVVLEPRFEPAAVLAAIRRHGCTLLSVVPTMLHALLEAKDAQALATLRAVLVGGGPASPALLAECARLGVRALATYGLTEACSQVTAQRLHAPHLPQHGSGAPLSSVLVRIAAEGEGDEEVPSPQVGRILVRGPALMAGYWRGPARSLDPGVSRSGWFDTGDLGSLDEAGCLHVHARRTDLIVTGGENVYPAEIEQAIEALPGARRALVFGLPNERWGQIVAAAIELADNREGEGADAARWQALRESLAPHKRPRRVCLVDELPLTSSGKVDRSAAPERFAALLRDWSGGSPRP